MNKRKICVLGSTGSIGCNTLDIVRNNPHLFEVVCLSARNNLFELEKQISDFHPAVIVLSDENAYQKAYEKYGKQLKVLYGEEGLKEAASIGDVDIVILGIVGAAGLPPFLAALEAGKRIGLANKEVLVMAGEYLHCAYPSFIRQIVPVDSEHSAIFQCLQGRNKNEIEKIILTASGGALRNKKNLDQISREEALAHPNWQMGEKISIDSATLMNKGFEVIEAFWLFPVEIEQIEVVIHPQSIIHSMVSFCDGAILAHLGIADMRIPIQFALSYPERIENNLPRLNFAELKHLTFEQPDEEKFPCLNLAFKAIKKGNIYPAVLNACNEVSVEHFLAGKIKFTDIARCNAFVFENFKSELTHLNLDAILKADKKAREEANIWILHNI